MRVWFALAAGAVFATSALAQSQEQTYGFNAIARDDLAAAEARLSAQRAAEPREPSVLLNLAYIYARTGRVDQATALYKQVMASENVLMTTGGRQQLWSHDIAQRGMSRTAALASR
ncbi:MAG: tetratricopeptide repeat protein [Proteobacteria bacterium]|nr:tetratricopeptide repeat protein [Pseudomonadota bacterium]